MSTAVPSAACAGAGRQNNGLAANKARRVTAGFTSAGPRLQWIVLGHAGAAGLTGVFPAVALAAVAITFILIAAIAFLITAAVATVAWSLVSSS